MTQYEKLITLFFGTPAVSGVVAYLFAHATGIKAALKGGSLTVETISAAVHKADPQIDRQIDARLTSLENRLAETLAGLAHHLAEYRKADDSGAQADASGLQDTGNEFPESTASVVPEPVATAPVSEVIDPPGQVEWLTPQAV